MVRLHFPYGKVPNYCSFRHSPRLAFLPFLPFKIKEELIKQYNFL